MNLLDVLALERAKALHVAQARDEKIAGIALDKHAQGRLRQMASRLKEIVVRPFRPTVQKQIRGTQKMVAEALLTKIPKPPRTITPQSVRQYARRLSSFAVDPQGKKVMTELRDIDRALGTKKLPLSTAMGVGAIAAGGIYLPELFNTLKHWRMMRDIAQDREIPQKDKKRAQEVFQVLRTHAPSIARDPIFARDFTRNLIRHEAIDHKVVSDLVNAEKAYHETKGKKTAFLQAIQALAIAQGVGG